MCSSPRHLNGKELHAVEDLVCRSPFISSPHRPTAPQDTESEVLTTEDFEEPIGNVSLGLSDEHGNEVDLECGVGEPRELTEINWEQVNQLQLVSNATFSVDLECPVDREKYERLWRLIAYYSTVPAHLERAAVFSRDPHSSVTYRQDSEKDAQHYTGVKVNMKAHPAWLMQASVDLQLNRLQSSAKMVKLILKTSIFKTMETDLVQRQRRAWVLIESTNTTRKVFSAMLGSPGQMSCNVQSSEQPLIRWMLPDGSKVDAPYSSPDNRMSVSTDGRLLIKAVSHADAGIYYCIARVQGDFAVHPFHLTVQESSIPPPGEDTSGTSVEEFAGNRMSLDCTASGSPDAEISWILPSSIIVGFHTNSSRALVYPNGTLRIPQIQLSDSGYYKCIAMNQHGVDTLATKINVVRRKGLVRPLRRFPTRPQSASGVSTQIRVPTDDTEDSSGDTEVVQDGAPASRLDSVRRRDPGASRRRINHPSRNMRPRPPVVRKPAGSRVEDRTNTVDTRRRINVSKSKIDPEKWADILAKIRDRNTQNGVTLLPTQRGATLSQKTTEVPPDSVTVHGKESQEHSTTHTPVQLTQTRPNKHEAQDQRGDDDLALNSQHTNSMQATTEHTTHGTKMDPYTSSNGSFFLPQTTSAPLHAVTLWQASTNAASDVDGVTPADPSEAPQSSENRDRLNVAAGNDRKSSSSESQMTPSFHPNESARSQEEKDFRETATPPQFHTPSDLQSEAMSSAAAPTSAFVPSSTASERQPSSRRQQHNSRLRNGGRRKRPNRRKQKMNKANKFTATTPVNTPPLMVGTTASTQLEVETLSVFSTTVLFTNSQETSSGRLSHEEITVSRPDHEAFFPPTSSYDAHQPAATATLAASLLPKATPGLGHGDVGPQTATAVSVDTSLPELAEMFTTLQTFPESSKPSENLFEETEKTTALADLERSFGGFQTVTQPPTDVESNKSGHDGTLTDKGERLLLKEVSFDSSLLPSLTSPSPSTASYVEHLTRPTSGYASTGSLRTSSTLFQGYFETEHVTTVPPVISESSHISAQNEMTRMETEETPVTSAVHLSATSSAPEPVTLSRAVLNVTKLKISETGDEMNPSLRATTQYPQITANHSQDQQTETNSASELYPTTLSPDWTLASKSPTFTDEKVDDRQTVQDTATAVPTAATVQPKPSRKALLTSTGDVFGELELAGRGSTQRGKPRITKTNFQTITVKAETDARLPCEAEGQPEPFLLWTHLATGMYD